MLASSDSDSPGSLPGYRTHYRIRYLTAQSTSVVIMGVARIAVRNRIAKTGVDFAPDREVVTEQLGTTVVKVQWLGFTHGYRGVVAALKDYEVARWVADIGRIDRREGGPGSCVAVEVRLRHAGNSRSVTWIQRGDFHRLVLAHVARLLGITGSILGADMSSIHRCAITHGFTGYGSCTRVGHTITGERSCQVLWSR